MAAGLGFKTFTTGEVLTAGDVNGYLMQGINVFATTAARDAAITLPQEGQFAFTKDTNGLWYYDGSAWVASGATGDIEGVTAGVGISGGGTSGTVTVTNSMATAIDAKGDLVPGTGADTFARLAVGANNTVLTADSAQATGLKWATPAGGLTFIARTSFSAVASQSFDAIFSSTYKSYLIVIESLGTVSGNALQMQLRYSGTTQATNYYGNSIYSRTNATRVTNNPSNNTAEMTLLLASGSVSIPSSGYFYISQVGTASGPADFNGAINDGQSNYGGIFNCNNATSRTYTGFLLKAASNMTGTVSMYGLAAS
jgi:hypothetical protein